MTLKCDLLLQTKHSAALAISGAWKGTNSRGICENCDGEPCAVEDGNDVSVISLTSKMTNSLNSSSI